MRGRPRSRRCRHGSTSSCSPQSASLIGRGGFGILSAARASTAAKISSSWSPSSPTSPTTVLSGLLGAEQRQPGRGCQLVHRVDRVPVDQRQLDRHQRQHGQQRDHRGTPPTRPSSPCLGPRRAAAARRCWRARRSPRTPPRSAPRGRPRRTRCGAAPGARAGSGSGSRRALRGTQRCPRGGLKYLHGERLDHAPLLRHRPPTMPAHLRRPRRLSSVAAKRPSSTRVGPTNWSRETPPVARARFACSAAPDRVFAAFRARAHDRAKLRAVAVSPRAC